MIDGITNHNNQTVGTSIQIRCFPRTANSYAEEAEPEAEPEALLLTYRFTRSRDIIVQPTLYIQNPSAHKI